MAVGRLGRNALRDTLMSVQPRRSRCLDDNEVLALVSGSSALGPELEEHVDVCGPCRALVASALAELGGPPRAASTLQSPGVEAFSERQRVLEPGTLVDHFRVTRLLRRGGMGEVYLAHDLKLDRDVALKTIGSALLGSPQAVERFQIEARAMARLSHPNIVTIHAVGEHRGRPYVALEYVEGETLRDRLLQGRLELDAALAVALAVAEALAAAHAAGVWHRDLKPSNVLLGADGRTRLLDFGLAKIAGAIPADESGAVGVVEDATSWGGTPRYMAPEQWRVEPSSPATDIWAFGVMLYEMLEGRHPFVGHEPGCASGDTLVSERELRDRVTGPEPSPAIAHALPEIATLVSRCLEKRPALRALSAELVETLRPLVGVASEPTTVSPLTRGPTLTADAAPTRRDRPEARDAASRPRLQRRRRLALAAACASLAVPAVAWLVTGTGAASSPHATIGHAEVAVALGEALATQASASVATQAPDLGPRPAASGPRAGVARARQSSRPADAAGTASAAARDPLAEYY
jgi:serine/threonine protein kinase